MSREKRKANRKIARQMRAVGKTEQEITQAITKANAARIATRTAETAHQRISDRPSRFNSERYSDPTAYQAMLNIYRAERARSGKPGSTGSLARVEHYPSSSAALA